VPLLARLALRLGGELLAVLVADVAEPRAARHVLAAFDPAVHVEPAPAATAAGAGNTGRLLVFLGAFGEDPLLLPDGNAPCMLTDADDQYWPLRPTPHFQHWLPLADPGCLLIVVPGRKPVLVRPHPQSFWEALAPPETDHFWDSFEVMDAAPAFPKGRVAF